jgi:enoyl-CoA hydratase
MADQEQYVMYHREGYIGSITLNRPDKRNALNPEVWEQLDQAIAEAEKDDPARVVLVRGAGKSFCAGLDLSPDNALLAFIGQPASASQKIGFYRAVRRAQDVHTRLERLTRPTIAVVQGHCMGAGLELAVCCDMILTTADTVFSLPEAKLAFITDVGGLQRLSRRIPTCHVREIAYRAHRFDGVKAGRIQLVNEVLPDRESLEQTARQWADEIAANPPLAVQGAKEVFLFDQEATLEASLDHNASRSAMIVPSEDQHEAVAAYLEKRRGEFKGA